MKIWKIGFKVVQFGTYGLVHHAFIELDTHTVEKIWNLVATYIARYEKEFLCNILFECVDSIVKRIFSVEYLAFAVYDIFLQIKGYLLSGAEILQCFRNGVFRLLRYSEKIVNADFACKDNGGIVGQIDVLCPEIFGANTDNLDKLSECDIKFQLFSQIKIRAAVAYGFWLRNQQICNFQNSLF